MKVTLTKNNTSESYKKVEIHKKPSLFNKKNDGHLQTYYFTTS